MEVESSEISPPYAPADKLLFRQQWRIVYNSHSIDIMKSFSNFFVICLIFLTTMWTPINTSARGTPTILVLGDSLSAAYEMPEELGWVNLLRERINSKSLAYEVQNESISGDTSSNGLYRMREIVGRVEFSYMVLALGANDGLRGLAFSQMKQNLSKIIEMAKGTGAKVLLVGINLPNNYGSFYKNRFEGVYKELQKEYDLELVDDLLGDLPKTEEYFLEDMLHPNERAQPIILKTVWQGLVALEAVK